MEEVEVTITWSWTCPYCGEEYEEEDQPGDIYICRSCGDEMTLEMPVI